MLAAQVRTCPACGARYEDPAAVTCVHDGRPLDDPLVGRELGGRYRILSFIGAGGMAAVYRARQIAMDRDVAVKVLGAEHARNPDVLSRFEREARAATRIQSVRVVTVIDYGVDDGILYIVMELLEGGSLDAVVAAMGRPDLREALRIGTEIARGVEAAHRAGVVHRDLKPGNVIVTARERAIKVLDFGVAKIVDDGPQRRAGGAPTTETGRVLGTPHYMSPESISSDADPPGPPSDVYSLGVLLFELFTGRLPFEERESVVLMTRHLRDAPPRMLDLAPELPRELDALVAQMLAKRPSQRPAAAEVARALESIAARHAESTGSFPTWARPAEPAPPRRWGWIALAVALLSVAAGALVWLMLAPDRREDVAEAAPEVPAESVEPPERAPAGPPEAAVEAAEDVAAVEQSAADDAPAAPPTDAPDEAAGAPSPEAEATAQPPSPPRRTGRRGSRSGRGRPDPLRRRVELE